MRAHFNRAADVLYPECTSEPGRCEHPANGARRAPAFLEPRRSHFGGGSVSKSRASNGRVHLSGPRGRAHSKFRRHRARGEARARALPARGRGPRRRARAGHAAPARARPGARRARRRTRRPNTPRPAWRREFSLLLGLERLLSEEEPKLADGTVLSAHQVDALSGTLTALLAEAQRTTRRAATAAPPTSASPELLASADILGPDDAAPTSARAERRRRRADADARRRRGRADEDGRGRGRRRTTRRTTTSSGRSSARRPTRTRTRTTTRTMDELLGEDEREDEPRTRTSRGRVRRGAARLGRGRGRGGVARRAARGPQRRQALLVRARDRRRQDGRRARLRRGLADRRRADPHPPAQPRRPVPRRAARPRLLASASAARCCRARTRPTGPVTVETYQWFVRNAGKISSAYTIVICDEAHTALGEKTSGAIRDWTGPIFIGMTATGALIARHVTDLFPTQTSRFDLAQAARRGVIAPLRCVRIPPGRGRAHDRQGAAAPRRGRHRVRPGDAGRTARPAAVQPGRRQPLQDALQRRARRRLRRRRAPRLQPRRGVPRRGHQGAGGLRRDAQARAGARSSRATSAATSTC